MGEKAVAKQTDEPSDDTKPSVVQSFSLGNQKITIFERPPNGGGSRSSLSLRLERSYRKRDGSFESSKFDLYPADIATACSLLDHAKSFLLDQSVRDSE